jgi:hypothetical protein
MVKHPLQTMIEEAGFEPQSYSGRAMFGRRCLGVTMSALTLGKLISELMEQCLMSDPDGGDEYDDMHKAAQAVKGIRWDNMGMDMIYYWPDVPFTDDEDEDNDEHEGLTS